MDNFKRDLARGKLVEAKHLSIIQKTYPDAHIIDGYCKEWDIYIPSVGFGIEVKSDKMSQKTGNIVVEIEMGGKPSALSTTKAKYWIFDTGLKSMTVKTDDLKLLVHQFETRKFVAPGDTKQKEVYLVKQKFIEDMHTNIV